MGVQVACCREGMGNGFEDGPQIRDRPYKRAVAVGRACSAAFTRSGVNGPSRRFRPIASKMALPMAAKIGTMHGSPDPDEGSSGRLSRTMSTSGTLLKVMTGYVFQSTVFMPLASHFPSSISARLTPCSTLASFWHFNTSGLLL